MVLLFFIGGIENYFPVAYYFYNMIKYIDALAWGLINIYNSVPWTITETKGGLTDEQRIIITFAHNLDIAYSAFIEAERLINE